jgi:hypothetical protein
MLFSLPLLLLLLLLSGRITGLKNVRMPALREFPIINVVHPAYHWEPNGGQGSFCEFGNRLLS